MPFLLAALGFLSGSVLYSAVLPKLVKGIDIRQLAPDHNPGAANAFQYGGVPVGIASLLCDLLKALLPVRLAFHLVGLDSPLFALCLCAPVLGHAFSPFAHFKGGKAIAASFGALLALLPDSHILVHLAFWYILFSTLVLVRPHAYRTVLSFGLTALAAARQPFISVTLGVFAIFATVSSKHLSSMEKQAFSLHLAGLKIYPSSFHKNHAATH